MGQRKATSAMRLDRFEAASQATLVFLEPDIARDGQIGEHLIDVLRGLTVEQATNWILDRRNDFAGVCLDALKASAEGVAVTILAGYRAPHSATSNCSNYLEMRSASSDAHPLSRATFM